MKKNGSTLLAEGIMIQMLILTVIVLVMQDKLTVVDIVGLVGLSLAFVRIIMKIVSQKHQNGKNETSEKQLDEEFLFGVTCATFMCLYVVLRPAVKRGFAGDSLWIIIVIALCFLTAVTCYIIASIIAKRKEQNEAEDSNQKV